MTTTDYTEPSVMLGQHPMPLLGFGTWQIENDDAPQATTTALELGYRHIDTATGYGNESGIGSALADSGSGPRRRLHHHQAPARPRRP